MVILLVVLSVLVTVFIFLKTYFSSSIIPYEKRIILLDINGDTKTISKPFFFGDTYLSSEIMTEIDGGYYDIKTISPSEFQHSLCDSSNSCYKEEEKIAGTNKVFVWKDKNSEIVSITVNLDGFINVIQINKLLREGYKETFFSSDDVSKWIGEIKKW